MQPPLKKRLFEAFWFVFAAVEIGFSGACYNSVPLFPPSPQGKRQNNQRSFLHGYRASVDFSQRGKKLSQGDIEKRTGLLRCYVSRVENGHTVPAIETLEKFARALEVPLYQLMYDGTELPKLPTRTNGHKAPAWGDVGKDARFLKKLCRFLAEMSEGDRELLLSFAENVTRKHRRATAKN